MNKKTQIWLGIAAVGVAGYWLWKKNYEAKGKPTPPTMGSEPKSFANLTSKKKNRPLPPAQYGDVFQGDGIGY
jgi:hypothetical protein